MATSKKKKKRGSGKGRSAAKGKESEPTADPELLPKAPGASKVDKKLVTAAREHVASICDRHEGFMAFEVGKYLFETFFSGDARLVDGGVDEHKSLRALAPRKNRPAGVPSHSWLSQAIRAYRQLELLPSGAQKKLPFSHHTLLLPIADENAKRRLAEKAMAEEMTKRDLLRAANKVKAAQGGASTGRPRKPAFLKGLNRLPSIAEMFGEEVDWSDPFPGYSYDAKIKAKTEAEEQLSAAKDHVKALQAFIREAEKGLKRLKLEE